MSSQQKKSRRKRPKQAGGSAEWRSRMGWIDMLRDAPRFYHPDWMHPIRDPGLKAHVKKLYLQLRRDADNGSGVTLLRDLVLRRIVWNMRILERIEQAIEEWDIKVLASVPGAEEMLLEYMRFHQSQSKQLIMEINIVLVPMPPMKSIDQIIEERDGRKSTVVIPKIEDLTDD